MAGNTFGQLFRITTFGESHGGGVGCVIDGCPPNLAITAEDIQKELDRRKPGQSDITTPRAEKDKVHILSGIYEGVTTGAPIMLLAQNEDIRPEDYDQLRKLYRPGHADYTFQAKYGIRDWRGSGRASARETLARVAAGAIAKKYLKEKLNIDILSYVQQVGDIEANVDKSLVTQEQIESNIIRCPDNIAANEMIKLVEEVRDSGDSVGGIIVGLIRGCPIGLGEPVFDKLSADLGKGMLSINAVKGFDIGSGFAGADMRGSEHNDEFYTDKDGRIRTRTNNAGGTLGGISNGEDIYFRVAIKPVSTISKKQKTLDLEKNEVEVEATGRHDPCVLPRAIPIVDAMSALVIMDHYLRNKAQNG
ncbi:MAG TPA: chorismate synthase [Candidatus Saccharimonadales bacterium]|nr:chorismate synthase [Candidatus Saccharimonadales bacterium]